MVVLGPCWLGGHRQLQFSQLQVDKSSTIGAQCDPSHGSIKSAILALWVSKGSSVAFQ